MSIVLVNPGSKPGQPPLPESMKLGLGAVGHSLSVRLVIVTKMPNTVELAVLRSGSLRLAVTPSRPVTWITCVASIHTVATLAWDAPYLLAAERKSRRQAIASALGAKTQAGAPATQNVAFDVIEALTGLPLASRQISVSAGFMQALAKSILANAGSVTPTKQDAAIGRDYRRWPTPTDMAKDAVVSEVAI